MIVVCECVSESVRVREVLRVHHHHVSVRAVAVGEHARRQRQINSCSFFQGVRQTSVERDTGRNHSDQNCDADSGQECALKRERLLGHSSYLGLEIFKVLETLQNQYASRSGVPLAESFIARGCKCGNAIVFPHAMPVPAPQSMNEPIKPLAIQQNCALN